METTNIYPQMYFYYYYYLYVVSGIQSMLTLLNTDVKEENPVLRSLTFPFISAANGYIRVLRDGRLEPNACLG